MEKKQLSSATHRLCSRALSGWSSRFRTLEKQWQKLVIQRTEMGY